MNRLILAVTAMAAAIPGAAAAQTASSQDLQAVRFELREEPRPTLRLTPIVAVATDDERYRLQQPDAHLTARFEERAAPEPDRLSGVMGPDAVRPRGVLGPALRTNFDGQGRLENEDAGLVAGRRMLISVVNPR